MKCISHLSIRVSVGVGRCGQGSSKCWHGFREKGFPETTPTPQLQPQGPQSQHPQNVRMYWIHIVCAVAVQAIAYGPFDSFKLCQEKSLLKSCFTNLIPGLVGKTQQITLYRFVVRDTTWAYCCLISCGNASYFMCNILIVLVFA